jgi:hypothetical protein
MTVSRQSSSLTGIQYSMRLHRDSGNTQTGDIYATYSLESADSYRFAGQTATLSFYAKVGANFSGASSNGIAFLFSGTGTDQNLYNGFTGRVTVGSSTPALTTSWQRFTITGTVASNATQMGLLVGYVPTGTAGANDWIEVTGVQLELGSVATTFKRASESIGGELALCQRYYQRITAANTYGIMGTALGFNGTTAYGIFYPKVSLRNALSIEFSALGLVQSAGILAITSLAIQGTYTSDGFVGLVIGIASGGTADRPYAIQANNNGAAYLAISGEL